MKKSVLQTRYEKEIRNKLHKKFGYKSVMQIPKMTKIVISMGLAQASKDKQTLQSCFDDLQSLAGQKPVFVRAKKSIANFKLRQGQVIGAKVTLRNHRMYDFFYRFTNISAPRIPDFRGVKKKSDGRGNYTLGLKEQTIFPEIDLDKVKFTQGMHITFVTTAHSDEECKELLGELGMPFKKEQ